MLINERFKSPNKEFEKVFGLFRKKDYFDEKSQVKKKQEEFVRFLKKGDPMATKVFKQNKENMKSSLSFIEDMVMDYNKKNHFEAFKIFSTAVNDVEMKDSKSAERSGNFIKSKIHNNSQKYSLAIYSAIRKQKFNNYKDVHKDVDELISKNEGFSSDAQRKAAFANGYEEKGKKKNESVNEGKHDLILDKLADLVKGAKSFMDIGNQLKKQKIKYSFSTSMIPIYRLDKLPIAIVNKRYTKPNKAAGDRVVGDTVIGLMESIKESVNEATIKGRNNRTGESFGMVIGSDKKNREGDFEVTIRSTYSARIHAYTFVFDKSSNLTAIKDYGSTLNGKFPDMSGSSVKSVRPNPRETITQIAKVTSPAFAKKIHQHVKKVNESVNEAKVNYNFSEDELKRVLKLLGRNASTEIKMIKAFEKAFGRKLTRDEMFESVNEGKKRYYQQDRVGSAKYTISYHDGKKKHNDGSDFFDIQTFKNKKDLAKFVNTLHKGGYVYGFGESVNEAKYNYKADALTAYFKGKIDAKELDKIARDDFKSGIATKKELSNFLSNKFTQDVMSDTYGIPAGTLIKRVRGLMKFAEGVDIVDQAFLKAKPVKEKEDGVPQGYNPMVEDKKQIKDLVKKVKFEKLFYDVLATMEKKYGKRNYRIWLEKSLKDFGVNPKHYDYRTNASAEEKLFQLGK